METHAAMATAVVTSPIYRTRSYNPRSRTTTESMVPLAEPANAYSGIKGPAGSCPTLKNSLQLPTGNHLFHVLVSSGSNLLLVLSNLVIVICESQGLKPQGHFPGRQDTTRSLDMAKGFIEGKYTRLEPFWRSTTSQLSTRHVHSAQIH